MYAKYSNYNFILNRDDSSSLIYNTYSGSFIELENEILDFLLSNSNIPSSISYFDDLLEQGIIVPRELNEYERILFKERAAMYDFNPSTIVNVIAPTLKCNMQCTYCFEANRSENREEKFDISKVIKYLKTQIYQYKNLKSIAISWFGGEPLLKLNSILDICNELIPFCKDKSIYFLSSIVTNGLLLDRNTAILLKEKCNLQNVQITLDGTEKTYCKIKNTSKLNYKKVIENIINISDLLNVTIRLNASKDNIDNLKELIDYLFTDCNLKNKIQIYIAEIKDYTHCIESNIRFFEYNEFETIRNNIYEFIENKYDLDFSDKLIDREFKTTTCGLIRASNSVIGPNGELYKCEHSIGDDSAIVGSIEEGLLYNEAFVNFCSINHFEKCRNCKVFPLCMSGCRSQQISFGLSANDCLGKMNSLRKLLFKIYKKESEK